MRKNKVLFAGCSLTAGYGLPGEKSNPDIWTTKLSNKIFSNSDVVNIAESGHSNDSIFIDVLGEITKNSYDYVIVAWSETNRINYNIGLELYHTKSRLAPCEDYNLVGKNTITGSWLFKNILMNLDDVLNEHWAILRMVKYTNILSKVQQHNGKIFFVNGIGCWPNNYFTKQCSWQDADEYTKKNILQMDNRSDDEISRLYNKIHLDYAEAGGIQENLWLNLYNSMSKLQIDNISDSDHHPGIRSQGLFADHFSQQFSKLI
mgnify:FL=1|tara:strand:- start:307 stop:1089 length:783 start_codon:yes stop_codon:yes gene_type:complete